MSDVMCDAITFPPPLMLFSFYQMFKRKRYTMMERSKVNHNIKYKHTRECRSKKRTSLKRETAIKKLSPVLT